MKNYNHIFCNRQVKNGTGGAVLVFRKWKGEPVLVFHCKWNVRTGPIHHFSCFAAQMIRAALNSSCVLLSLLCFFPASASRIS